MNFATQQTIFSLFLSFILSVLFFSSYVACLSFILSLFCILLTDLPRLSFVSTIFLHQFLERIFTFLPSREYICFFFHSNSKNSEQKVLCKRKMLDFLYTIRFISYELRCCFWNLLHILIVTGLCFRCFFFFLLLHFAFAMVCSYFGAHSAYKITKKIHKLGKSIHQSQDAQVNTLTAARHKNQSTLYVMDSLFTEIPFSNFSFLL